MIWEATATYILAFVAQLMIWSDNFILLGLFDRIGDNFQHHCNDL